MKLSLLPKLVEKIVWISVISFCKIFIPSYAFDTLFWLFSPPNHAMLWVTLLDDQLCINDNYLVIPPTSIFPKPTTTFIIMYF